jgi:hypothetical protein
VNGPVGERRGQRVVYEPVLLDEREPVEATAGHGDVEVVAAAGAIDDCELARVGKRAPQQLFDLAAHRV